MAGTFFGISVASTGLAAQRMALEVVSQNIAHANDPTYKRERLIMTEGVPLAQSQEASGTGVSVMGTGVQTGAIQRICDALIEHRLIQAGQSSAQWEFMSSTLSQIEAAVGEPSDTGLQTDLDTFWASWNKVATTPNDVSLRTTLVENTQALCSRIQYLHNQIGSARDDLNASADDSVNTINEIANEMASLNGQITVLASSGSDVNELLNRRDGLVQDLAKIVSISQFGEGGGDFVVTIGGRVLVQGTQANTLKAETDSNGNQAVRWASDDQDVVVQGGRLKALQDLRDTMIPDYLSQLDQFASTLVTEVNALHATGKTLTGADGGAFFVPGTVASNIALDPSVANNPRLIAASLTGDVGDSGIAAQIAVLGDQTEPTSGLSINQMYRALVGDIGSAASTASKQADAQDLSLQQFTTQQQSISGVSLDEEMTNMIKFQQAYNACARVITVMDEMLGFLTEQTGAVGR
jgi:flagellar hook-associated protein 1 FlgK